MNEHGNILIAKNKEKAESMISRMEKKSPLFLCVGGTTETAKIPELSMAGKNPEFTDYTPTADLEILIHGKPKSIEEVPATPSGIPTPALISKSALELGVIPVVGVDAGMRIKPEAPVIDMKGEPGESIKKEVAVGNPSEIFENARAVGASLGELYEYLIIGETIPGGTTTALGVLSSMGVKAEGKVSSSMPENPHSLKIKTVHEGLKSSGLEVGGLKEDPIEAISLMGDPMIPAVAGLAAGCSKKNIVMLAGGTQMAAVLKVLEVLGGVNLGNIILGTTRWIIQDKNSDLIGLVDQVADIPIIAADLDFSRSRFDGLKAYEEGFVKEGVGAGGGSIGAMLGSESVDKSRLMDKIERVYEELLA